MDIAIAGELKMNDAAGLSKKWLNPRGNMPLRIQLKYNLFGAYLFCMYFEKHPFSYRDDSSVPEFTDTGPVCVMDARCSLCALGAKWIARNDKNDEFRIVPLQSDLGNALMHHYGLDPADPTSWLYLVDGRAYASLDALICVGQRLGGGWKVLFVLRGIPRVLRDSLYKVVARNRYRWFGTTDLCSLPDPDVQRRLMS